MIRKLSSFFYSVSSPYACVIAVVVMFLYAQFIMGAKASEYDHLLTEDIKVPDLMFGYDLEYVYSFSLLMGPSNLNLYLKVVIIWDTIFPVIYTGMNILLLSYVYKNSNLRFNWLNILPLISLPLELLENSFEIWMIKDFLNHGTIKNWLVNFGATFNVVKWIFTYFIYILLGFGALRVIYSKIKGYWADH